MRAISLERITRKKFDGSFPRHALDYVLQDAGLTPSEIDLVVFFESPELKLKRQLMMDGTKKLSSSYQYIQSFQARYHLQKYFGKNTPIVFSEHHISHLLHSYYTSEFSSSCFLIIDGVGEESCSMSGYIDSKKLEKVSVDFFPHSLGLLYSTFTQYLGFYANSDEYKVMGLAAYGKASYVQDIKNMIEVDLVGNLILKPQYFNFSLNESKLYTEFFSAQLPFQARKKDEEIEPKHQDLAASIQAILEEILILKVRHLKTIYPEVENLVLGGGVALNCLANMAIKKSGVFENIFIPFACGDEGSALGAAFYGARKKGVKISPLKPYLGKNHNIANSLDFFFEKSRNFDALYIAEQLEKGQIMGLFSGGSEFGPRALGARSIIAHPNIAGMKDKINKLIKNRENFRPLAPVMLESYCEKYFKDFKASPYMTMVFESTPLAHEKIPQALHVDGTARVQSLNNPDILLYKILLAFHARTDIPALINTSMNLNSEPIVESPLDALFFFVKSNIDFMIMGDKIFAKKDFLPKYRADIESLFTDYNSNIKNGYTF